LTSQANEERSFGAVLRLGTRHRHCALFVLQTIELRFQAPNESDAVLRRDWWQAGIYRTTLNDKSGNNAMPGGTTVKAELPPSPSAPGSVESGFQVGREDRVAAELAIGPHECTARYLRPIPRVRAGLLLGRNRAASSCMDLSDGLADAVLQVAEASNVGMTIDAASLPIAAGVREWHASHGANAIDTALSGGDDYELLFTVRPSQRGRLRSVRRQLGELPITKIGVVTRGCSVRLSGDGPDRELPAGYEHFR